MTHVADASYSSQQKNKRVKTMQSHQSSSNDQSSQKPPSVKNSSSSHKQVSKQSFAVTTSTIGEEINPFAGMIQSSLNESPHINSSQALKVKNYQYTSTSQKKINGVT